MRKSHFLSIFLIVFLSLQILTSSLILNVKAQVQGKWLNRYVYDLDYGNGTHTSTSYIGTQVFWDGSQWRELNFEDHYASEGYYLIENSHITAKIFDWYTVFLDPDNQRVCVDDERWIVEVWNEKTEKWREVDLYNPSLTVHNNETHLVVRRIFDTYEGIFEVKYIVWQASFLKHDVKFTTKMSGQNQFRVTMKLTGIYHDKIRHSEGLESITSETHIISPYFFVGENNTNLVLSEYLWSLGETNETSGEWKSTVLKDIVLNTHAKGCKADIIIGNYTLGENESLLIDPDSDTWQVSAGNDDAVEYGSGSFDAANDYNRIRSYTSAASSNYVCSGTRFISVNIPQGSTIISADIKLYTYSGSYDDMNSVVYGNDVDNAQDFSDNAHIISEEDRPRTSASVSWVEDGIGAGVWATKSVTNIIQEIVNRGSWSSGNALVLLFIANTDVYKVFRAKSYENSITQCPKLEIEWTSGAQTYELFPSINLNFSLSSLPNCYRTHDLSSSIDVTFDISSMLVFLREFSFSSSIDLLFDLSSFMNFFRVYSLSDSIDVTFQLSNLPSFFGTFITQSSIDLTFDLASTMTFYQSCFVFPSIDLVFDLSSTLEKITGYVYSIFPSIELTFDLSSVQTFFGEYIINPIINVNFALSSFVEWISGIIHIYPSIVIVFDLNNIVSGGIVKGYEVSHAIALGIIAFVLAIIGICIAVTKKD